MTSARMLPGYGLVTFGDGNMARLLDIKPVSYSGVRCWWVKFEPTEEMIEDCDLYRKKVLGETGSMSKLYHWPLVAILRYGTRQKVLIRSTWDGGDTELTKDIITFTTQIKSGEMQNENLRAQVAVILKRNDILTKQAMKYYDDAKKIAKGNYVEKSPEADLPEEGE